MVTVEKLDTRSKAAVKRFIQLHYHIYRDDPVWVPPLVIDMETALNRQKNPFFEHSDGDFFMVVRDGRDVGRIAVMENRRYNQFHGTHTGQFYFFECENDPEAAGALFEQAFEWARQRGMDRIFGPKGFGILDGYGLLIEGFDQPQMMTMMNYNPPYYRGLVEGLGFTKEVDFVSCFADTKDWQLSERIHHIAERVQARGTLRVQRFKTIGELKKWADRIGQAYNNAFVNNWEYYPLTEREIAYIVSTLETIANPRLIKVIVAGEEVVGFLFAFPDAAAALKRSKGKLFPFGLIDILIEMRRTKWVAVNSAGILPEYQGRGGNALLYSEMDKTIHEFNFEHGALYQVAETAVNMRRDLDNLGGIRYKNHRVYQRSL